MISWIVATHDPAVLGANLAATLRIAGGDELIIVEHADSIAAAYNQGQSKASNAIQCYVHHDIQILDLPLLREKLRTACLSNLGMVGLIGCRTKVVPWWNGRDLLGSVEDTRFGVLNYGSGGKCAYLDGLLLATVQQVEWDESAEGWHMYDHDACEQMLTRGLPNYCLTGGHRLVRHNTTGSTRMSELAHWTDNVDRFRDKWNAH